MAREQRAATLSPVEEGSRRDGDEQSPDFPGGAANHLGSLRARRGEGSWDSWLSSRWTWPASDDGACVGQAVQRKRFELFLSFFITSRGRLGAWLLS